MLLLLLNGFHRYVFALVPVDLTAGGERGRGVKCECLSTQLQLTAPDSPFTVDDLRALK